MEKSLEERLAALERHESSETIPRSKPRPKSPFRHWIFWLIIITSLVVSCTAAALWIQSRETTPLPAAIVQQANFQIYYPSKLPDGYVYSSGSARIDTGVVFYDLRGKSGTIAISQQPSPAQSLRVSNLPGFKSTGSPIGEAGSGTVDGIPTAIIQTETTLINIAGAKDTPPAVLSQLARDMAQVSK